MSTVFPLAGIRSISRKIYFRENNHRQSRTISGSASLLTTTDRYYFLLPHFSIVTKSGEPMKIDEYVPAAIPMISASEKCSVDGPPAK